VENTKAINGWHKRICVDEYDKNCQPTGKKFCVTFSARSCKPDTPLGDPEGPPIPGIITKPGGNGVIVTDNKEPATKTGTTVKTCGCSQDRAIKEYLQSLLGQRGEYGNFLRNCRTFSEATAEKIKQDIENGKFDEPNGGDGGANAGGAGDGNACCDDDGGCCS
jgi:hypothetical protein